MLRIYFTTEDIARLRVAAAPDPLWEITNSFQILITRANPLVFGEWRRLVRARLPVVSGLLAALLPPRGYSPDFLTPDLGGRLDLESAVDTVLSTPRSALHSDLTRLAGSRGRAQPLPDEIRALAEGDPVALRRLSAALHAYHRHALAPYWAHIRAQVDADRAVRTRAVLAGGADGLLASFRPVLRWQPPVLETDYPVDRGLRLGGRGLLLQPSFFCDRRPVTLASPELTPVLVYPIQHTLGWDRQRGPAQRDTELTELSALIGRTRAAILQDVVTGRTTGELAQRFLISGPAASYHTAVLRRAGLLLSMRRSKHVLHTITPEGLALLDGPEHPPPDV
ncbi:ArsR/SmtB family transcription factor [Streptomyces sp. NPDC059063]|uniref:ArsR/SmtB family transcription factor n=1 Tax=unclassified Streptomyces TaxID=2593676 RepID=UPI0036C1F1F8